MSATAHLPRVTYANTGVDLTPLHDFLDARLPDFKASVLGRTHANSIGGKDDTAGTPFAVCSPIDGVTELGSFFAASDQAVDRAVGAAQAAFPAWAAMGWQGRIELLRAWAKILYARKYDLALAALFEVGKSRVEALGEADEVFDMVCYYCDEMERHNGYVTPLNRVFPHESTVSILRPLGVFGVVSPFNYPAALLIGMSAGALVTGNTVVMKPSEGCSLTARIVMDTLAEAGVPPGVVNLVVGGNETGAALVEHPGIAGVAFTGSYRTGMHIMRLINAGPYARPVIAEMGGKNPAYVSKNADLAKAAQGVARSAFGLQGQKCSACSVVYVDETVRDEFVERLRAYTAGLVIGNPEKRETFLGPVYNEAAAHRMTHALEAAHAQGAVLFGGKRATVPAELKGGQYFEPTLVQVDKGHVLTKEEQFLPLLALRSVTSLEEAIAEGNDVLYGLAAGIYTEDAAELEYFLNTAEAGALYANRPSGATTGAWPGVQSFCGWKGSGVTLKGGLGPHYLPQFMREQSRTVLE
ncbi:aldehyde dehydrogenase family protein [Acetobacter sp. TBRC 12305]|uniref:L-glutamate gamma-semialdehyde dehydrogenase n=1 Tax=Acetobacter garciniae TaxID=2817435 RepID=A0A939KQW4_9PROT|nr:aldehyde dehydrogenase family protein [Acetobacter garciniae]MBO1324236.1 aldehyde dehydrogenase family protein [Acetobacter garciniae]MBX0343925.1 aldehyde dehydrogenase family protein [Acetobacter garciniae]